MPGVHLVRHQDGHGQPSRHLPQGRRPGVGRQAHQPGQQPHADLRGEGLAGQAGVRVLVPQQHDGQLQGPRDEGLDPAYRARPHGPVAGQAKHDSVQVSRDGWRVMLLSTHY